MKDMEKNIKEIGGKINSQHYEGIDYRTKYDGYETEDEFLLSAAERLNTTGGRVYSAMRLIALAKGLYPDISDDDLKELVVAHIEANEDNATFNVGSPGEPLRSRDGRITQNGLTCLDIIFQEVSFVRV